MLLAVVFAFRNVSNNTEDTLTQEDTTTDEIKVTFVELWSGREDLNLRPLDPEPSALPNCATPRKPQLNYITIN